MDMVQEMLNGNFAGAILPPGEAPDAVYGLIRYTLRDAARVTIALRALTLLGLDYSLDYTREAPTETRGSLNRAGDYEDKWVIIIHLPDDCVKLTPDQKKAGK